MVKKDSSSKTERLKSKEDDVIHYHISNLVKEFKTNWKDSTLLNIKLIEGILRLQKYEELGYVKIENDSIKITNSGKRHMRKLIECFQ